MIFVTVGLHKLPFDRLIRAMDKIAGHTTEEVVMQTGNATYQPEHAEWFRFTTGDEMPRWYDKARVVVTHGGYTIVEILRLHKPVIAVPRQGKKREHMNDHQVEFTRTLERTGLLRAVYDIEHLGQTLLEMDSQRPRIDETNKVMLIKTLRDYLDSIDGQESLRVSLG